MTDGMTIQKALSKIINPKLTFSPPECLIMLNKNGF